MICPSCRRRTAGASSSRGDHQRLAARSTARVIEARRADQAARPALCRHDQGCTDIAGRRADPDDPVALFDQPGHFDPIPHLCSGAPGLIGQHLQQAGAIDGRNRAPIAAGKGRGHFVAAGADEPVEARVADDQRRRDDQVELGIEEIAEQAAALEQAGDGRENGAPRLGLVARRGHALQEKGRKTEPGGGALLRSGRQARRPR